MLDSRQGLTASFFPQHSERVKRTKYRQTFVKFTMCHSKRNSSNQHQQSSTKSAILKCNLGQNIVDKFKKFSETVFFMECFIVDFSLFSGTSVIICLSSCLLSCVIISSYSLSSDNNLVPFHLWWKKLCLNVKKFTNILSTIVLFCQKNIL